MLTDDSMGYFEIPLSDLANGPIDTFYVVKPLVVGDYVTGSVNVSCKFVELKPDPVLEAQVKGHAKCNIVSHFFYNN